MTAPTPKPNPTLPAGAVALLAALSFCSTSQAGTWAILPWDDSSIAAAVNASTTYTHAVDFVDTGSTTVINGVTFEGFEVPGPQGTFSNGTVVGGSQWSMFGGYEPGTLTFNGSDPAMRFVFDHAGTGPPGDLGDPLAENLTAQNPDQPFTLTLSGLSAGTDYVFTYFSAKWVGGNSNRQGAISTSLGDTSPVLMQAANDGTDSLAQYTYNSGAATEITFTFGDTAGGTLPAGGNLHLYSFTNAVIPEPEVALLAVAAAAGFALQRRRRRGR